MGSSPLHAGPPEGGIIGVDPPFSEQTPFFTLLGICGQDVKEAAEGYYFYFAAPPPDSTKNFKTDSGTSEAIVSRLTCSFLSHY